MAGRLLNRRELRKQADEAELAPADSPGIEAAEAPAGKKAPAKAKAAPKARKPRPKKAPARLRARWGIFDAGMKQIALFDYNQHAAAQERLADLLVKKPGSHFLQIVKEPMPESAPSEGAAAG
jgi:hypothetical protein